MVDQQGGKRMGRPRVRTEPYDRVTLELPHSWVVALEAHAALLGISRVALIKRMLYTAPLPQVPDRPPAGESVAEGGETP